MNRDELHARARRRRLIEQEGGAVDAVGAPVTVEDIVVAAELCGVQAGGVLLVHSSLSGLGWVNGGPQAVIEALFEVIGPDGTLVMPTHTTQLTDPSVWAEPPVPERWHERIRATMPPWDPHLTPTRWMGQVSELFRLQPGVLRSDHPHVSFAARGPLAERITGSHPLCDSLGQLSPLGRMYDEGAHILLLGVGFENNTALHLAESRAQWPSRQMMCTGAPLRGPEGRVIWTEFMDQEYNSADFADVGRAFELSRVGAVQTARLGCGSARWMSMRALVDFAVDWFESTRLFDSSS